MLAYELKINTVYDFYKTKKSNYDNKSMEIEFNKTYMPNKIRLFVCLFD